VSEWNEDSQNVKVTAIKNRILYSSIFLNDSSQDLKKCSVYISLIFEEGMGVRCDQWAA
jgi:hypothetical protein